MKKSLLLISFWLLSSLFLCAESNNTLATDLNTTLDTNSTSIESKDKIKEQVEKQMAREKKYAKEQIFYQGSDYDLSASEIDESSLEKVPLLEPDYDFDMDDVYRDDL